MTRTLALCADDFGASRGIADAVVEIAGSGHLAAVSCLVNGADWARAAPLLRTLPVEAGLHFNLTEGAPLSAELGRRWPRLPTLPRLIAQAHLRLLPLSALRAELAAQLEAFAVASGFAPRFIDGHQHVHHLPGVRRLVLEAAARLPESTAVRSTGRVLGPGHAFKRFLIEATGGSALRRSLERRGLAHNPALTGVYDFRTHDYRALMQRWLERVPQEGSLLFCHPATAAGLDPEDSIAAARRREYAYLRSAEFDADLVAADVTLGPVWRRGAA